MGEEKTAAWTSTGKQKPRRGTVATRVRKHRKREKGGGKTKETKVQQEDSSRRSKTGGRVRKTCEKKKGAASPQLKKRVTKRRDKRDEGWQWFYKGEKNI